MAKVLELPLQHQSLQWIFRLISYRINCGSDHKLLIAKFRLKLKKVGKATKPFRSVQSLSCVQHFVTPWTGTSQASLSITYSQSLLKLMSIEWVMPSNHLILSHPLLLPPSIFPSIKVFFPVSQLFPTGGQSIGVSASASVLPMNSQDWFPLG